MRRRLFLASVLLAGRPVRADMAEGDPRLARLYGMFLAPCCWRENLLAHQSPKADEVRAEIRNLVRQGRTDEEIKTHLTGKYQQRILAVPEGIPGRVLAWMPLAVAAAGTALVIRYLRRSLRRQPSPAAWEPAPLPPAEWEEPLP